MGRGDKKTAKGKRARGSYGNTRPKKNDTPATVAAPAAKVKKEVKAKEAKTVKEVAAKKTAVKKTTVKKAAPKKVEAKKDEAEK